jgi:putative sterol carrier protein
MVTRDLVIDDGKVTVAPAEETRIDCTITSFEPLDQIRMIRGELNFVTGILQGRLEAEGDPMLAVRIAGSMRGLGNVTPQEAR